LPLFRHAHYGQVGVEALVDIDEALAVYVREDRGTSKSRRIFLPIWAPRIGLTGPGFASLADSQ
jgi:hypothetical protein